MDLSGVSVKPAEGRVILKFVDDDTEDEAPAAPGQLPTVEYDGCLAIVVAVGAKCTSKPGQAVITSQWARDGMKLGEGHVLASQYDIVGTITE